MDVISGRLYRWLSTNNPLMTKKWVQERQENKRTVTAKDTVLTGIVKVAKTVPSQHFIADQTKKHTQKN